MIISSKRLLLFALYFFYAMNAVQAQPDAITKKRFSFRTLNYENGLINNVAINIITDANGFTWVATLTGLQRFNGRELKTINPIAGNDTFKINYPVKFFALNDSSLWISVKSGILQFNSHTNTFSKIISTPPDQNYFSVLPLMQNADDVWCLQKNKGIVLYNTNGGFIKTYPFFDSSAVNPILKNPIFSTTSISNNNQYIFLSSGNENIFFFNIKSKDAGAIKISADRILSFVCTQTKLFVLTPSSIITIDIASKKIISTEAINKYTGENVSNGNMARLNDHALLLSLNAHLYQADSNFNIQYELTDFNRNNFLSAGYIYKIYPDKQHRIWLLTNNDIKRIENFELPFEHFIYPSAKNNFVRAMYVDEKKHIVLAGCFNGGLQLYDSLANPLWQKPVITNEIKDVIAIEKLYGDSYLIITFGKGWFILNIETKKIQPVDINPAIKKITKPETANFANNLQRISDSEIIIATPNNVFNCVFKQNKLESATALLPIKEDGIISCALLASDKTLWTGTSKGTLYHLNKTKLSVIQIPNNYIIRSIAQDAAHIIWVGTDKGLYAYSNTGKFLKKVSSEDGLRNDMIYSILPYKKNIFVASNLGLSYISAAGAIENFSKEMGLQDNEFNTNSAYKTSNGKFFFGGVNGITAFYPSSLHTIKDSARIYITQLTVNDSSFNTSSGVWQKDAVVLKHNQNRLRFDIAAIGMLNTNEYIYQYRFKGLDSNWQTTNNPQNINYILAPGNYILEIKYHPLFSAGAELHKNFFIIIQKPWWQLWWVIATEAIIVVLIITWFIKQYNKKKYLKKITALQTEQQMQQERERISRELHDNIGAQISLINSNIDWLIDDAVHLNEQQQMEQLSNIQQTSKNVMGNLRESIWALHKEKITLEEFADKLKSYVQNMIRLKPAIKFIAEENIDSNTILSPTETLNLFRICQECINNVMKHAAATLLKISITSNKNNSYFIIIKDNGKGFEHTGEDGHYGLQNIAHRAKELNATLKVESKEGKGTSIIIHK